MTGVGKSPPFLWIHRVVTRALKQETWRSNGALGPHTGALKGFKPSPMSWRGKGEVRKISRIPEDLTVKLRAWFHGEATRLRH